MSYNYEDYEEEPTQEEMEEFDGMENTDVKIKPENLVIKFNTVNFANGIIAEVTHKVKEALYKQIIDELKKDILVDMKEQIKLSAHEIIKEIIDDYMENEKLTIGSSSFWDDDLKEVLSMKQFAKRCIKQAIEKGEFSIFEGFKESRYNKGCYEASCKKVSFQEYIKDNLGITNEMKQYINSQINDIRKQINGNIKDMFDASTKQLLADNVLQVLMANDTYQKIQNNIACIADNRKE